MPDMLKVRTIDFKRLDEKMKNDRETSLFDWEFHKEELIGLMPENWESEDVVWINEGFKDPEMSLLWLTEELQFFKLPYEYFYDGGNECDDYWEFHNPAVDSKPKSANCAKDDTGYILKTWDLNEMKDLPAPQFKEAVLQFFENPFKDYPALEEISD